MITNQSEIMFADGKISKRYLDNKINKLSSVDNELACLDRFEKGNNIHCPKILEVLSNGYIIERYSTSLGTASGISKSKMRRVLFTISKDELISQLEQIETELVERGICHRDINPGNLLFWEKDQTIRLIDFYWASMEGISPGTPDGLNAIYGMDDTIAMKRIKYQIALFDEELKRSIKALKPIIKGLGRTYFDGSSVKSGTSYHKIDIPYFSDTPFHKDLSQELVEIIENIHQKYPKKLVEIGSAVGYSSFNMMRHFGLDEIYMYEADPYAFRFLNRIKYIFRLNEIRPSKRLTINTELPLTDLALCMNVHMWLENQMGRNSVNKVMRMLFDRSKETFFQTVGADGAGMYKISWLKDKDDIGNYLVGLTDKNVKFIRTTMRHEGRPRHLFKISEKGLDE